MNSPTVLKVFNESVRAIVTLIEVNGQLAVRKEFRPGCERFLQREVFARSVLADTFPEIPPLLEHQDRYVISPFYEDVLRYQRADYKLFPLSTAFKVVDFLERFYDHGFAILDSHPENVLLESDGQLRFVDFEFLHEYGAQKPRTFSESWDLVGPPPEWHGDRPRGGCPTWSHHWYPYVGLSVQELQTLPPGRRTIRRGRHWVRWLLPRRVDDRLSPRGRRVKHRVATLARNLLKSSQRPGTRDASLTDKADSDDH